MRRQLTRNQLIVGDALTTLRTIPTGAVDTVLTSPPYFQLRNYGVSGQLGAEPTIEAWVGNLRTLAAEVHRVLTPTGTFWLNVGDSYATHARQGAPRKGLLLGPERLAVALARDGWLLRNKIVWSKPNPLPTSVRDRLMARHEYIYVFGKQPHYYFDLDAIREPHRSRAGLWVNPTTADQTATWRGPNGATRSGLNRLREPAAWAIRSARTPVTSGSSPAPRAAARTMRPSRCSLPSGCFGWPVRSAAVFAAAVRTRELPCEPSAAPPSAAPCTLVVTA